MEEALNIQKMPNSWVSPADLPEWEKSSPKADDLILYVSKVPKEAGKWKYTVMNV